MFLNATINESVAFVIYVLGTYYVFANLSNMILILASWLSYREQKKTRGLRSAQLRKMKESQILPKVSILIPAFNEEPVITSSVQSFLSIDYPNFEIVIINDGSQDQTLAMLVKAFSFQSVQLKPNLTVGSGRVRNVLRSASHPNLVLIDQMNGGKACALNTGLRYADGDLVCSVDADTIPERDSLHNLARVFLFEDRQIVAVSGTVRIINGCPLDQYHHVKQGNLPTNHVAMFQILEYIRAFFCGRVGWDYLGATALMSGAFTMFNKHALAAVQGFAEKNITEDFEISLRLRAHLLRDNKQCKKRLISDPICWTLAPEKLGDLRRQRRRWHLGGLTTMWSYKFLFFNGRFGSLGLCVVPYMVVFELLSPIV
jgi:biofilm PGA synthesis N-glycosyltransferase PgaC